MPYVAGGSLRSRLEREGPLPVAAATRIAIEAAEALDHAHRRGFVHRDIKPENVLLQDGHAVVADFGIAALVDPRPRDAADTDRVDRRDGRLHEPGAGRWVPGPWITAPTSSRLLASCTNP